jgi:hypothetical protein
MTCSAASHEYSSGAELSQVVIELLVNEHAPVTSTHVTKEGVVRPVRDSKLGVLLFFELEATICQRLVEAISCHGRKLLLQVTMSICKLLK